MLLHPKNTHELHATPSFVCVYVCMCVCVYVCMCVCVYRYASTSTNHAQISCNFPLGMCVCVYVYACMCVHPWMCMCVHCHVRHMNEIESCETYVCAYIHFPTSTNYIKFQAISLHVRVFVCLCVCMYIHSSPSTNRTRISGNFSLRTCVRVFVYICVYVYMCTCVHTFFHIHEPRRNFWQLLPVYVRMCVCVYACTCVLCVYVHVCTYIRRHPRTTQEFLATSPASGGRVTPIQKGQGGGNEGFRWQLI